MTQRHEEKPQVYLKSIYVRNFRNIEETEGAFHKRLNLFYGDNAQGKTNLLEAIFLICTGRSFRTLNLKECIRDGASFFYIEAEMEKEGVSQKIALSFDGENKKLQINATTFSTFQPLLGILPIVLLTPEDSDLITGPPAIRRRFLNLHLAQRDPLYVHHLARFSRALKQRNCLLKAKHIEGLDAFEEEMAISAEYLWAARKTLIAELKLPHLAENYELSLSKSVPSYKDALKNRHKDLLFGATQLGPHRDEIEILIEGRPAAQFASEGQKKTLAAALRLAELERTPALFGIDDFGMHLDATRQKDLQERLGSFGQVFVTAPGRVLGNAHPLHIAKGKVGLAEIEPAI